MSRRSGGFLEMTILDRYVIAEMTGPFLFGVCTFTLLFMSVDTLMRAARMFADNTQGMKVAAVFVAASIPGVLAYSFPMSSLLACLMAFGRMSADSEVVAMKAGGMSLYRIALPGLVMTALLSCVAWYLLDRIAPEANYRADTLAFFSVAHEMNALTNLKVQEIAPDGTERWVVARDLDLSRGVLKQLLIVFYNQKNVRVRVMFADDAVWSTQQDGHSGWVMNHVQTQDLDGEKVTTTSYSETMEAPIASTPAQLAIRPRGKNEMPSEMLLKKIEFEQYMATRPENEKKGMSKVWSYMVEYYSRLAIPTSCFVFGLFGIPLGLQPHRTSKSIGLGLSIIFIFGYYVLMTVSRSVGEYGLLPPMVAAWLPNMLFAAAGIVLLVRAGKICKSTVDS